MSLTRIQIYLYISSLLMKLDSCTVKHLLSINQSDVSSLFLTELLRINNYSKYEHNSYKLNAKDLLFLS